MTRTLASADEAVALLRPGMTVFVAGMAAEPLGLRAALARNPAAAEGVRFVGGLLPGMNDFDYAGLHPTATSLSGFVSPAQRASFVAGRHEVVYASYCGFTDVVRGLDIDVAMVSTSSPGPDGRLVFGLGADFNEAGTERARLVIAETNEAVSPNADAPGIDATRAVQVAGTEGVVTILPDTRTDPDSENAADYAAALIRDGDCIQIGIGRLPSLILRRLSGHRRLGLHTGLASDACLDLIEAGAMTGEEKTIDRGLAVTAGVVGSPRLYAGTGERRIALRAASYTHGLDVLRRIRNLTCLNSAIEVDLFGQVNSNVIGSRIVSGPGGFPDFAKGTAAAPGGRSIVTLPSQARGRSRIVPALAMGTTVTGIVLDVDHVVTEHGAAALRGTTLDERARRLIAIAAPEHRDGLAEAWAGIRRGL